MPAQSVGYGTTSQPVSAVINTEFMTGTPYYYRIVGSNRSGTTRGSILSVHQAPLVTTLAATSVGTTTAELNGLVTPYGQGTTTWFEYGTDSTLASFTSTTSQSVGSGTTNLSVNAVLTGLSTGTRDHRGGGDREKMAFSNIEELGEILRRRKCREEPKRPPVLG